jgi:hypothetical protein
MNGLNKEDRIIMDNTYEDSFQYGKVYYFDKSGMPIDECDAHKVHHGCKSLIETCCRIHIPRGFKLANCTPGMCFNLSGLSCIKNPIVQKVDLPSCDCKHPKKCEVVSGYEIRAVGDINFSVSIPICPIRGFCFPKHSHVSSSATVPVNKIISHTCCPTPCSCSEPCVDWTYSYFCVSSVNDDCGCYIQVKIGVSLEYTGTCECDEE